MRDLAIAAAAPSAEAAARAYRPDPVWSRREFVLGIALAVLLGAMASVTGGRFLQADNLRDILITASIPAVAAAGMTALIVAAQIDISIGAILAVAAVAVALLADRGWPVPALLLVGMAAGALLGAVNGTLTAGLKIPAIVATLATMGAIRGLLVLLTHGNSIPIAARITDIGVSSLLGVPMLVIAAVLIVAAMATYLARTRPGRQHYAVGSNPRSASLSGVPVAWVTFRSFVLLGALVGAGGFLFVCRYTPIYPSPPKGFELEVITATVVGGTDIFGGRGTVAGSAIACVFLASIAAALVWLKGTIQQHTGYELPSEVQPAIQGLLILGAVLYNRVRE